MATLELAGRFQSVEIEERRVILDVAHNPAAAQYLALKLAESSCEGRTFALLAIMADKDGAAIVAALKDSFDGWFLADLKQHTRAMPAGDLADVLYAQAVHSVSVSKNVRQALRRALSLMGPDDRLVVFGSFFTVADVMRLRK